MSVRPIPEGSHSVTPYLVVRNAKQAIDFYQRAFGAVETLRLDGPGETIVHAELRIGDSQIMLSGEWPDMNALSPESRGGTTVSLLIYTEDCNAMFDRAVAAGATMVKPVQNQFYGDLSGTLKDPFGHQWTIATHVEDVAIADMQTRMEAAMKGQS